MGAQVEVVATTISGSIRDWGKVERIVPLFRGRGMHDVVLHTVESHGEARERTREIVRAGCRTVISAGGSGTFNAVLEGCIDADVGLDALRLGFLRKGSADLIGKALGMPDEIESAIDVFVRAIREDTTVPCDVIEAKSAAGGAKPRRFVGYGGAEVFGEIPRYTENRLMKYYKGVLGQVFGDMGPFFVGSGIAVVRKVLRGIVLAPRRWTLVIDEREAYCGALQAMIIVNGDLGPDLPFASGAPLGSGEFHLFTLRDLGAVGLLGQLRHAWDASILDDPARWGFKSHRVAEFLEIRPEDGGRFPLNVDGSILPCISAAHLEIIGRVRILA